ncbi:thioesterase domain-containing protein [Streptomyces sp. NPDC087897]|uniref:thioesterase domain-containing protein n=1 Tax=Streptomyces sp. NPDC087897 TaxID=3365817 RepID=UPI00382F1C6F
MSDQQTGQAAARLVSLTGREAAGRSLFLVHAVGGTVNAYGALAKELAGTCAVTGIEAFGISEGEPVGGLAQMVERYVAAVRGAQPEGPYRIGGWSMGGIVAFEMARELERRGVGVEFVALMDSPFDRPWGEPGGAGEAGTPALRIAFAEDVAGSLGWDMPQDADGDPLGWLAVAVAGDPHSKYLPLVREDLERRFAVFCAHARAVRHYRPSGPVDAELRLLFPDGSMFPEDSARWAALSRTGARRTVVKGDHHSFLKAPVVSEVARFLGDA